MSAPPFPGSPRPSSGYCSSDDDLANSLVTAAGVTSGRRSDCTSVPSSSVSGSCPVTPDSASSDVNFSASGLFEDCLLGGFDSSGFLLSTGCDVSWLRSPTTPLPNDLGLGLDPDLDLDLGSGIPDVFCVAGSRTSSSGRCGSFGVSVAPNAAVFETGNADALTGSGRLSLRRFPLPVVPSRCQRIPMISVKVADSSSSNDDSVARRRAQLPSDRGGSHGNATRTRRVAMTTTTNPAKSESSKRTMVCRCVTDDVANNVINNVTNNVINDVTNNVTNDVTNDVIDDVTLIETPRHVLSDHGYSTSPSLFPPPPPAKQPRLSPPSVPPPGSVVREASILAALLLTKEPLRANAGSDALVAVDGSRRGPRRDFPGVPPDPRSSLLEGLLLTGRGSAGGDGGGGVPAADCVSGWKAPFSGLTSAEEEEGYVLDSDHLLRDKDGLHVGLASAEDDLTWTTSPQMSSLDMDELFTQHFEPDDLWMHLSDLL